MPSCLPSAVHEENVINHAGEVFNGRPIHACKHRNIHDEEKSCDSFKLEDHGIHLGMLDSSSLLLGLGIILFCLLTMKDICPERFNEEFFMDKSSKGIIIAATK